MDDKIKLNLGCGYSKLDGYVNMDKQKKCNPDLLCDIVDGVPFVDSSVDFIAAYDFLEHIPLGKTMFVINEIYRVLKSDGVFEHITPSTDGRGAFQDPTHVSFWNVNSWLYYTDDRYRGLYGIKAKFTITKLGDFVSDAGRNIIHTYGVFSPVK
jgi:predicted SAM-dependent methyltransferase